MSVRCSDFSEWPSSDVEYSTLGGISLYQAVGDRFAVFGSKAGADSHPDWYRNLVSNPRVKVEVGTETITATARTATGAEREEIWTNQKELFPWFADYEAKTEREIPVVVLER